MLDLIDNVFPIMGRIIGDALRSVLPSWLAEIVMTLISITVFLVFVVLVVMSLIYVERRVIAFMQDRRGPNRVGPYGLLQPVADVLKLFAKEDLIPASCDPWVFRLAPIVMVVPALLIYAVIPFGDGMVIANLDIGILFFIALSSTGAVGILMAGWGSNNKFALLGAMRAAAQLISYEIPLVFSLIGVALIAGSLSTVDIVRAQSESVWFFLIQPIGFVVFFLAAVAELNRTPFDLMEAESEIVAGYHIEYSGMRFALFYLAEYLSAFAIAALATTLFFGGWLGPVLPGYVWFVLKTYALFFILFWLRGTLPRVRVDQLMGLAWKFLVPLAIANMFLTGIGVFLARTSPVAAQAVIGLVVVLWVGVVVALVLWLTRRNVPRHTAVATVRR